MSKIDRLEQRVIQDWQKVVPDGTYGIQRSRGDDGSEHVELRRNGFYFISTERGLTLSEDGPYTLEAASKRVLFNLSVSLSLKEELKSRKKPPALKRRFGWNASRVYLKDDRYSRWNWMYPAYLKMQKISLAHGQFAQKKVLKILKNAPLSSTEIKNAQHPLETAFGE